MEQGTFDGVSKGRMVEARELEAWRMLERLRARRRMRRLKERLGMAALWVAAAGGLAGLAVLWLELLG